MSNKERPAETAAEKTTEADVPTSCPTIGNTIVVGSQSPDVDSKTSLLVKTAENNVIGLKVSTILNEIKTMPINTDVLLELGLNEQQIESAKEWALSNVNISALDKVLRSVLFKDKIVI